MNTLHSVTGDTLATNKSLKFLSYYLEYSIRAGAYASNLFFGTVLTSSISSTLPSPLVTNVIIWVYGILLFEIIWRFVNRVYKPKFKKKSEAVKQGLQNVPGLKIIEDEDYEYRVRNEKLIFQLAACYGFQFAACLVLNTLGFESSVFESNLVWAALGGLLQLFNFFGVVTLIVGVTNRLPLGFKLFSWFLGLGFSLPLLCYVVYVFRLFY